MCHKCVVWVETYPTLRNVFPALMGENCPLRGPHVSPTVSSSLAGRFEHVKEVWLESGRGRKSTPTSQALLSGGTSAINARPGPVNTYRTSDQDLTLKTWLSAVCSFLFGGRQNDHSTTALIPFSTARSASERSDCDEAHQNIAAKGYLCNYMFSFRPSLFYTSPSFTHEL